MHVNHYSESKYFHIQESFNPRYIFMTFDKALNETRKGSLAYIDKIIYVDMFVLTSII